MLTFFKRNSIGRKLIEYDTRNNRPMGLIGHLSNCSVVFQMCIYMHYNHRANEIIFVANLFFYYICRILVWPVREYIHFWQMHNRWAKSKFHLEILCEKLLVSRQMVFFIWNIFKEMILINGFFFLVYLTKIWNLK